MNEILVRNTGFGCQTDHGPCSHAMVCLRIGRWDWTLVPGRSALRFFLPLGNYVAKRSSSLSAPGSGIHKLLYQLPSINSHIFQLIGDID